MYNYMDLSDTEFEDLATDIISEMLNVKLFRFGKGKDGGIDLCDSVSSPNIVVQIKHYFRTPFSTLFSSLKKELEKVKRIKPTDYYIVCSGELTPENIKKIYELFEDYMESERNIITLIQIENFLREEKNRDILLRHYKLWLCSVDLIQIIQNNDILIDSDVLYDRILRHKKLFVQTHYFNKAKECLEKNKVLMLIGDPGVGKTITSEMLVLHFIANGYGIRFTTEVDNLSALKKSLSKDPNKKEIIYLDDCLGQCYFKMRETQINELQSLITYIKYSQNKILLLNSRVTIYKEALSQNVEFYIRVSDNGIQVHIIDMSRINPYDKAKILYNHLYFSSLSKKYKSEIRCNNLYEYITYHKNYSPRIIEFIVNENMFKNSGKDSYSEFVKNSLASPEIIWQNEYDVRIKNVDRIFVNTLYSLTDTFTPLKTLKGCFNYYITNKSDIDPTIDQWRFSLNRLTDSFLQVTAYNDKERIGVINPSVNDFLRSRLFKGAPGHNELVKNIINVIQSYRLLENADEYLLNKINNHEILNFVYNSHRQKTGFITYMISKYKIKLGFYEQYILDYVTKPFSCTIYGDVYLEKGYALSVLFDEDIFEFYNLIKIFEELDFAKWRQFLKNYFFELSFKEIVRVVNSLYATLHSLDIGEKKFLSIAIPLIQDSMEEYDEIEAENIINDKIVFEVIDNNTDEDESIDFEAAAYELEEALEIIFKNEFEGIMASLPDIIFGKLDSSFLNFHILNVEDAISAYRDVDDYCEDDNYQDKHDNEESIIDDMFKDF